MTWGVRTSLVALFALTIPLVSQADDGEEPAHPVCRLVRKNSLAFCSMVDYYAVMDESDVDGAAFDAKARMYYDNVNVVLQRFGCHTKYSLYNCDDCREAYKYWICSIKFQRCGSSPSNTNTDPALHHAICQRPTSGSVTEKPLPPCVEGSSGRYRTCLSLCEDVVRKCPYVLNFQCPTVRAVHALTLERLTISCVSIDRNCLFL
jgi:Stretch-activated Ca2+-permeable channel component